MSSSAQSQNKSAPGFTAKDILTYLDSISDPEQAADLVSCAVLAGAKERQEILETVEVEARLRRLIQFLTSEIRTRKKRGNKG